MSTDNRYSFRSLELWKTAQDFAVEVAREVDALPSTRSADVIGRQLLRSATSVGANIAEGHSRFTLGAYRNHLSIAKGSAGESESWLNLLVRLNLLDADRGRELEAMCVTLMGGLTRRIVSLEQQEKRQRIREVGPGYDAQKSQVPWFSGPMVQDIRAEGND